jgi:hypothetical protein
VLFRSINNDVNNIKDIFKDICNIQPEEDDAVIYDENSITGEVIMESIDYNGIRIKLKAKLGSSITPMKFDIGFGDVITPKVRVSELSTLLNFPKPILSIYPLETAIAEKLNAMAEHSMINSRMKDFYDVYMILTKFNLSSKILKEAINKTFESRGTPLPEEFIIFKKEFYKGKQEQWKLFLENNKLDKEDINSFETVIKTLQKKLKAIL